MNISLRKQNYSQDIIMLIMFPAFKYNSSNPALLYRFSFCCCISFDISDMYTYQHFFRKVSKNSFRQNNDSLDFMIFKNTENAGSGENKNEYKRQIGFSTKKNKNNEGEN